MEKIKYKGYNLGFTIIDKNIPSYNYDYNRYYRFQELINIIGRKRKQKYSKCLHYLKENGCLLIYVNQKLFDKKLVLTAINTAQKNEFENFRIFMEKIKYRFPNEYHYFLLKYCI